MVLRLLEILLSAYLLCLFARAIFSWIEPFPRNRIHRFLYDITEPLVAPVRQRVPPVAGFDVAYLIVFFAVTLLLSLVRSLG
jgi:YggT family protein